MKTLRTSMLLGTAMMVGMLSAPAFASNAAVENTLRSRPELSSFYQGLANTGVLAELDPNETYTIFAPTNKAMAKVSQGKYPCFYSQQCVDEVADIMRNHIVAGPVQFGGGPDLNMAYSVDMEALSFGQISPSRNAMNSNPTNVTVNGNRIVKAQNMAGGMLYEINGVLATPQERLNVSQLKYVPVEASEVVLVPVPQTSRTVTKKVFYAPDGSPDGYSQTTVTTETH